MRKGAKQAQKSKNKQKVVWEKGTAVTTVGRVARNQRVGASKIVDWVDKWDLLSPEAQFQVSMLAPGTINCPYVEDHEPSKYPTAIFPGYDTQTIAAATAATNFTVIAWSPCVGSIFGGTGYYIGNGTSTSTVSFTAGRTTDSIYGTTVIFSKFFTFGGTVDIEFQAPQATLCGNVMIGNLPYKTFTSSTVGSLLSQATTEIDLKRQSKWSMKSRIQDRSLIHNNKTPTSPDQDLHYEEEAVAYAIIGMAPAKALDGTTSIPFELISKLRSHAVWLPAVSTSVLASVAKTTLTNIIPQTPQQEAACQKMEYSSYSTQPAPRSVLGRIVDVLAISAEMASDMIPGGRLVSSALSAAAGMLMDPWVDLRMTTSEISDLQWFRQQFLIRWNTTGYTGDVATTYAAFFTAYANFLAACITANGIAEEHAKSRQDYEHRVVPAFGGSTIRYYRDGTEVDVKMLAQQTLLRLEHNFDKKTDSSCVSVRSRSIPY
jgi:hypothetical protein